MITFTVHIVTKPSEHTRFVDAARALRDQSLQEPGNLEYSLWTPLDGGNEVVVIERWRDEAAVNAHHDSTHLADFRVAVKGAVAKPPVSVRAETEEA